MIVEIDRMTLAFLLFWAADRNAARIDVLTEQFWIVMYGSFALGLYAWAVWETIQSLRVGIRWLRNRLARHP